jgi:hypothetical protein
VKRNTKTAALFEHLAEADPSLLVLRQSGDRFA